MRRANAVCMVVCASALGCAPVAHSLRGEPTRQLMPAATLASRPQQLRFTWSYKDETFEATGDGVVRATGPDHARLDFFLRNGMAGGYAILVGDSLTIPGVDLVKRFLPPVPLLWATLGRLALPATTDTVARVDGDTLRVDLGTLRGFDASRAQGRAWRIAFAGATLARVEHIEDGKVQEWISRAPSASGASELLYVHEQGKRRLRISVTETLSVEAFDDAIWRRP